MRIKLDENLPLRLAFALADLGHDADTIEQEGLAGSSDQLVWEAAQADRRFLITQDLDFSDARLFTPGNHYGILLVRLGQPGRDALLSKILNLFQFENPEIWRGCIVVATERKIRVRRNGAA